MLPNGDVATLGDITTLSGLGGDKSLALRIAAVTAWTPHVCMQSERCGLAAQVPASGECCRTVISVAGDRGAVRVQMVLPSMLP